MVASSGTPELDPAEIAVQAFEAAMGQDSVKGVKVWGATKQGGSRPYYGVRPIFSNDFDQFIEDMKPDFPKGGEFHLAVIDNKGHTLSNSTIELAPSVQRSATPTAQGRPAETSSNDMLMQILLSDRAAAAERSATLMAGLVTAGIKFVENMGKGGGGRGDSPVELLNALVDLRDKVAAPQNAVDPFDQALDRMVKMRQVIGEGEGGAGGGEGGGIMGTINRALPIIGTMLEQQARQPAQARPAAPPAYAPAVRVAMQPQPTYAPQYAPPPQGLDHGAPMAQPIVTPPDFAVGQPQGIDGMQIVMNAVRHMLFNSQSDDIAGDIAAYLELSINGGVLDVDLLNQAIALINADPGNLAMWLASQGITEAHHVQTVARALDILTSGVADDGPTGGVGGGQGGFGLNGAQGGTGFSFAPN